MNLKKYIKGGLNSDVNPSLVPDGDYLNALNIRGQVGDDGKTGVVRPVPGHTKIVTTADDLAEFTGTSSQDIKHMCVDEVNGYAYAFISGTALFISDTIPPANINKSPRIVRIDLKDNTISNVISASKVAWHPDNAYYGWEDFVEAKVVGDTLIWINKHGYQFSLNVEAYKNKLTIPSGPYLDQGANVDIRDISLIKAPPCINLNAVKAEDENYEGKNFIKDNVFQFSYRYVYDGDEITVLSPLSNEVPVNADGDDFNCIDITIGNGEIISPMVKRLDLICRNTLTGSVFIIKSFNSTDTNPNNPLELIFGLINNGSYVHRFYNNQIYETIDLAYATKQFDAVPVTSRSIEISKDRVFLSNNVEGYDTPTSCDLQTSVEYEDPGLATRDYPIYNIIRPILVLNNGAPTRSRFISSHAIKIDDVTNPGWYELNIDGGVYTSALGSCTISNITTTIIGGLAFAAEVYTFDFDKTTGGTFSSFGINAGDYITLSGFVSNKNNGLFRVESVVSGNKLRLRSLSSNMPVVETLTTGIKMCIKTINVDTSTTPTPKGPNPTTTNININDLTYIGANLTSYNSYHYGIGLYYVAWGIIPTGTTIQMANVQQNNTAFEAPVIVVGGSQSRAFKSGSRYSVGIQYYDFAMRKCGVYTQESFNISTPERGYNIDDLNTVIKWTLPGAVDLRIPIWAKYYSIVRTDNLDTRYFIQGFTRDLGSGKSQITYAPKNPTTGAYDIADNKISYLATTVAIALDIENILNDGFGYIYEEANGDIVNLIQNPTDGTRKQSLKVIGQQGRYILLEPKDLGTFTATNKSWLYEIVRPYINTDVEPFYETQIYAINNWGTSTRAYSETNGSLTGDRFEEDGLEYMNLRTEFRNTWSRNLGRPCFIDPIGQVYRPSGIRWSNVFVPGSKINGLSTFDAIDYKDLPVELGPVNKLKTTSKAQSEGNIMLAIGQNYTASMYIGETSLVDNAGQSLLTTSGLVVGTVNILKGRFGTTLPASVVEYDGNVYWADILNECIVMYSANGLFAISDYGMRNFFRSYFKTKKTEVDEYNITQSPYIYGGYNPATDEYILSFTPVSQSSDQYPDASGSRLSDIKMMYRSGTPAKSVAFSLSQERWISFYSHSGPYIYFGGKMYNFVKSTYLVPGVSVRYSGGVFVFDKDSTINNFSGTVRDSFISIPYNEAPSNTKIFHAVSIEGTTAPSTTYVETFIPNNQVTSLISSDYNNREDVFYSELYRDRVSPNSSGTADEKMYTGDKMRGQYANMSMIWNNPSNFEIRFINVNIKDSIGHNKLSQ